MQTFFVAQLIVLILSATSPTQGFSFEEFVESFNKSYPTTSARLRAEFVFKNNVRRVKDLQNRNPYANFSLFTRWADVTQADFSKSHGLADFPGLMCQFPVQGGSVPKLAPTVAPLDSLDYVLKGATTPVKDQGKCSSCWAHATTAVVEGRLQLDTGKLTSLSEQYLLDCDRSRVCQGCCGGLPENAMQWLAGDSKAAGTGAGIASTLVYPYDSGSGNDPTQGHCNISAPLVAKVTGFGVLQSPVNTSTVLSAATQYGILSVVMDAHALQFYTGGIITDSSACSNANHAVAIVGYGTEKGVDYYKVRNSYGETFGEQGYFRISRKAGKGCGMYGCMVAATGAALLKAHTLK